MVMFFFCIPFWDLELQADPEVGKKPSEKGLALWFHQTWLEDTLVQSISLFSSMIFRGINLHSVAFPAMFHETRG